MVIKILLGIAITMFFTWGTWVTGSLISIQSNRFTDEDARHELQKVYERLVELPREIPPQWFKQRVDMLEKKIDTLSAKVERLSGKLNGD